MNNQQRELEASNQDVERNAVLEEQLREAATADDFFNQSTGILFKKLATEEINRIIKDITGDKYRKDLMGYNYALSDLHSYQKMLRKFQVAGSPQRVAKLQARLDGEE